MLEYRLFLTILQSIPFSVDSALLAEIGERLVGKPYIALAELVKNSYDADASKVTVEINVAEGRIVVEDDGHGMTFDEFRDFWMRIGSIHKKEQRTSRRLGRVMTGSKGIGRLAVQYLANQLTLSTTSDSNVHDHINAYVNWDEAISAGDLIDARVNYEIIHSEPELSKGTKIVLTGLKQKWNEEQVQGLAGEIWWLQPPFRSQFNSADETQLFEINILSPEKEYEELFHFHMNAIMEIWYARLVGKNDNGTIHFSLEYHGENPISHNLTIPNSELKIGDFEVRIYHLIQRQPHGVKVGKAREYMNKFGGVYVYDGGFQLPFYGDPKNDWLELEFTHSHRLSVSQLLPKSLGIVQDHLQFIPTLSRVLGVVNVNTNIEPGLEISITRDRFREEETAFLNLKYMIRYALDFYSLEEKKRSLKLKKFKASIEKPKYTKIEEVIDYYKKGIDEEIIKDFKKDIQKVTDEIESESQEIAKRVSLVGSLSTAGITTIAYQHETKRSFRNLEEIINDLENLMLNIEDEKLRLSFKRLKKELSLWLERVRITNSLFSYISNTENLDIRKRYSAKEVIDDVKKQVTILSRGINIDTSKVEYLALPEASLVEWGSIFQNIFINSFNALLDSEKKLIQVSTKIHGEESEILVQDTGYGVNLKDAHLLFEPFERRVKISPERQALGYGGTGLGLTIVQLIAHNIGCSVGFIKPERGFKTAFTIRWREKK